MDKLKLPGARSVPLEESNISAEIAVANNRPREDNQPRCNAQKLNSHHRCEGAQSSNSEYCLAHSGWTSKSGNVERYVSWQGDEEDDGPSGDDEDGPDAEKQFLRIPRTLVLIP